MLSSRTLVSLSKYIENLILNSLKKDELGFVYINDLIEEVTKHPLWDYVEAEHIIEVVESSALKRLEVIGNKIRLTRTTETTNPLTSQKVIPPMLLYYGTTAVGITRIKTFGIKSFKDDYIKLYADKKQIQVLAPRSSHIVYVEVVAYQAYLEGVIFRKGQAHSYITSFIPPKYIRNII